MQSGDLLVLDLVHGYAGKQSLHMVFTYLSTNGLGSVEQMLSVFEAEVLPTLAPIQTHNIDYDRLTVYNAFQPTEFATLTNLDPDKGSTVEDALPPQAVVNIHFPTRIRGINGGRKAISGIPESAQVNGVLTSGYVNTCQAFVGALIAPLVNTGISGGNWQFIIVQRIAYTTPKGRPAYRLPENDTEFTYYQPVGGQVNDEIGSQNSRKLRG